MSPLVDLLNDLRDRPAMYVGSNSLARLAIFLRGCHYAMGRFGVATDDSFLREFGDWVRARYNVRISRSWEDVILFYSADDSAAMKCFWELFDEYLSELGGNSFARVPERGARDGGVDTLT